jgi:hypothetical protein
MAMTKAERAAAAKRAEKKRRQSARAEATRITQKEKQPYVTAADAAAADAARTMTAEQIAAQYGANYAAATGTAGMLAPTTAANAANATSMLSGLVGSLPGAGSYDTTSLLSGFADSNAANARLGAMYAGSLAADIGAAGAAGIAGAQGRASERTDRLSSEERELRLKGDVAGSNYLTNLSNILNIRGQRQNLALSKFQLEQAKVKIQDMQVSRMAAKDQAEMQIAGQKLQLDKDRVEIEAMKEGMRVEAQQDQAKERLRLDALKVLATPQQQPKMPGSRE